MVLGRPRPGAAGASAPRRRSSRRSARPAVRRDAAPTTRGSPTSPRSSPSGSTPASTSLLRLSRRPGRRVSERGRHGSPRLGASAATGGGDHPVLETRADAGAGVGPQAQRDLALLVAAWRLAEDVGAASLRGHGIGGDVDPGAEGRGRPHGGGRRGSARVDGAAVRPAAGRAGGRPVRRPATEPALRLHGRTGARRGRGLVLTAAGWWWARGLLIRARRPGAPRETRRERGGRARGAGRPGLAGPC